MGVHGCVGWSDGWGGWLKKGHVLKFCGGAACFSYAVGGKIEFTNVVEGL